MYITCRVFFNINMQPVYIKHFCSCYHEETVAIIAGMLHIHFSQIKSQTCYWAGTTIFNFQVVARSQQLKV